MSNSSLGFILDFNIQSYWHIGSGLDGGAYADALALKNADGLPYIPGKSIKGLLKEAFVKADENNWFATNSAYSLIALLFGEEGKAGAKTQGILQISSGTLSTSECKFFMSNPEAKSSLFKVLFSTAIDEVSGVAKETSLRGLEVAVPMSLKASITINKQHPCYAEVSHQVGDKMSLWLSQAVTLITKLGAKRYRGLGQVIVTATQASHAAQGRV